jgi:hypothetical protein
MSCGGAGHIRVVSNVPSATARIDGFDQPVTRANLGAGHRGDDQRATSGK